MLDKVHIVLIVWLAVGDGANILSVLPSSSKSHFIYPNALLLELAASGHKVTVMSPFPIENPPINYTTIDISEMKNDFAERSKENMQMGLLKKFKFLYTNTLHMTNITLQHPEMKKLLKSDEKFDLLILDLFLTDALLGLSSVFDCPVVALSANGPHTWVNDALVPPRPASFVWRTPHMHSDFANRMNLGRRIEDAFFYFMETILMNIYHLPKQEQLFNQVFATSKRTFDHVRKNAVAVALVNSHFSISFPRPFLPNIIEVAGMQVNEEMLQPLPDDIKEFIENSEHGVIYFSLGGNIKSSTMDVDKKRDLIKALLSLKQNTIWNFDEERLDVDPKKIMIRKWLPQYEILAHNNTRVFITHAGLLSCTEAIYFAKNVIAVPTYGDQHQNAKKLAKANQGIYLDYSNFTGQSLKWAVEEIVSNLIFSQSIREASQRFREKPLTALETGKFWVEYVLRHQNTSHLQSVGLQMNHFELYNADVYVVIILILMLLLSFPVFVLKKLYLNCYTRFVSRLAKTKTN